MSKKKIAQSYICSSADWDCLVEAASSPSEAASLALQKQVQSDSQIFSVGSAIAVTPVVLKKNECEYIYSPSILADIGMHKYADDLSRNLEKSAEASNKNSKKKGPDDASKS